MLTIQEILDTWLTPELIFSMGECAYQRLIYTLGVCVPMVYIIFSMVLFTMLLTAIYKLVVGR